MYLTTQGVTEIMQNEAREEAELKLQKASSNCKRIDRYDTSTYILREGEVIEELISLTLKKKKILMFLVLAANIDEKWTWTYYKCSNI